MMKTSKFYYYIFLLCTLSLGLVSCQKEEDDDEPKNFGTEKYESISGLYEVENTGSGIKSIELTAGGEYIVVFTNRYGYYSPAKIHEQRKSMFVFNGVTTRSTGDNYVTGTYTYNEEDSEIILEGYGSLLVYSFNPDGTFDAFVLSTDDGERMELDVTKRETMEDSDMTQKLCRTWKPKSEEIVFKMSYEGMKNETVLDAKYTYSTGKITITKNMVGFTEEYLEDMFTTSLKKVVFSKAGTYMVYHEYDGYEESMMANWRWNDEKAGYLLYYWDNEQDYDYYAEGIVQVSFSGTTLNVSESIEMEEDGVSVIGTQKIVLVEAN